MPVHNERRDLMVAPYSITLSSNDLIDGAKEARQIISDVLYVALARTSRYAQGAQADFQAAEATGTPLVPFAERVKQTATEYESIKTLRERVRCELKWFAEIDPVERARIASEQHQTGSDYEDEVRTLLAWGSRIDRQLAAPAERLAPAMQKNRATDLARLRRFTALVDGPGLVTWVIAQAIYRHSVPKPMWGGPPPLPGSITQ